MLFDLIIERCTHENPLPIFIGASPGTGKSYLLNTIISHLRSEEKIVLACASTSSASLLLSSGKTLHAQFKVPINIHDDSMCLIRRGSQLARLIAATTLVIIDESTMLHRHIVEALDRSLRDIMSQPSFIFGGIAVVLSGYYIPPFFFQIQ